MNVLSGIDRNNHGHIQLEGLPNTRDLGGIPTKTGKHIAPRLLLRSGTLAPATSSDISVLNDDYRMSCVIDLRTEGERDRKPDPIHAFPNTRFVNIPVLNKRTMGITRNDPAPAKDSVKEMSEKNSGMMVKIYKKMLLDDYSQQAFKRVFDELANHDEGAVLWHCAVGKDRVGLTTVLLLLALDVPDEVILQDYLATNAFMKPLMQQMVYKFSSFAPSNKLLGGIKVLNMVDEQYLQIGLEAVTDEYGSLETYLQEVLDVTPEKKRELQAKYLI